MTGDWRVCVSPFGAPRRIWLARHITPEVRAHTRHLLLEGGIDRVIAELLTCPRTTPDDRLEVPESLRELGRQVAADDWACALRTLDSLTTHLFYSFYSAGHDEPPWASTIRSWIGQLDLGPAEEASAEYRWGRLVIRPEIDGRPIHEPFPRGFGVNRRPYWVGRLSAADIAALGTEFAGFEQPLLADLRSDAPAARRAVDGGLPEIMQALCIALNDRWPRLFVDSLGQAMELLRRIGWGRGHAPAAPFRALASAAARRVRLSAGVRVARPDNGSRHAEEYLQAHWHEWVERLPPPLLARWAPIFLADLDSLLTALLRTPQADAATERLVPRDVRRTAWSLCWGNRASALQGLSVMGHDLNWLSLGRGQDPTIDRFWRLADEVVEVTGARAAAFGPDYRPPFIRRGRRSVRARRRPDPRP